MDDISLEHALEHIDEQLDALGIDRGAERPSSRFQATSGRTPSRFVGQDADPAAVRERASRGAAFLEDVARGRRVSRDTGHLGPGGHGDAGRPVEFLRAVKAARRGDPDAHRLLRKGWVEGTDASGGYLVIPQSLPGYVEARRAAAPLRDRCAVFESTSPSTPTAATSSRAAQTRRRCETFANHATCARDL